MRWTDRAGFCSTHTQHSERSIVSSASLSGGTARSAVKMLANPLCTDQRTRPW